MQNLNDQPSPASNPNHDPWQDRMNDLPDLRWGKVIQARERISADLYADFDQTIEDMLTSIAADLDVCIFVD